MTKQLRFLDYTQDEIDQAYAWWHNELSLNEQKAFKIKVLGASFPNCSVETKNNLADIWKAIVNLSDAEKQKIVDEFLLPETNKKRILRGEYEKKTRIDGGWLYILGNTVVADWDGMEGLFGVESWTRDTPEQAQNSFATLAERWTGENDN